MNKLRLFILSFTTAAVLATCASFAFAGGGPVEFTPDTWGTKNPGESFTITLRVVDYSNSQANYCKGCWLYLYFENAQNKDMISPASGYTDNDGKMTFQATSTIGGTRVIRVSELRYPDGRVDKQVGSYLNLNYTTNSVSYTAPTMVYPQDGQTIDLEGHYMFRVNDVPGASGYLYGFFQDGNMVFENYRDMKSLSSADFALWDSHPYHSKFHSGSMKVMIRALVNNNWTDAREITLNLKPRSTRSSTTTTTITPTTTVINQTSTMTTGNSNYGQSQSQSQTQTQTNNQAVPSINPTQTVVVVKDSSASAELEKKVTDLQNQLTESKQKQSALESRLEGLISWIKSVFPFFK